MIKKLVPFGMGFATVLFLEYFMFNELTVKDIFINLFCGILVVYLVILTTNYFKNKFGW